MMNITTGKRLRLAVLASGRGSNFAAIQQGIRQGELDADICVLISNKKDAPALEKAAQEGIRAVFIDPALYLTREEYENEIVRCLEPYQVDFIVLAGYMRLVGKALLNAYRMKMVNIHPALLPSFTGLHAQRQALEYGVRYSGCTVHFVDEGMDTGPIILQAVVPVYSNDTEESLTDRILAEEHHIYKQALQLLAEGKIHIEGRRVIRKEEHTPIQG